MAAALAFYTLLTLTHVLLVAISMADYVFGPDAAQSALLERVSNAAEGRSGGLPAAALVHSNFCLLTSRFLTRHREPSFPCTYGPML